jgi:glycosyltransferase involved in cell wall biosynthesis
VTLGLIARADSRGLGVQTKAFYDHMHPARTMVINCPSAKPLPLRRDWYPDAMWIDGWPTPRDFETLFDGLATVYTAETIYDHHRQNQAYATAARMGVKVVCHTNPEFGDYFLHPEWPRAGLYAAPSTWMWEKLPNPKVLLPVPVATEHFEPQAADKATNFLHVVGRPAIHDRAGTADLLHALQYVQSDITMTITCQEPGYVERLVRDKPPKNIDLRVCSGDVSDHWSLYTGHHVLVAPRRFGGLSLPMQEACAAGMPVIAPDVSPNNDWLPSEWLVPANHAGMFTAHTLVDLYSVDHRVLAARIDSMTCDPDYYRDASARALGIAKQLSWENLKPEYERVLNT